MGLTTNSYYCKRLGVTFENGDKFIVKGKAYTSAYGNSIGYDYTNDPTEKTFYGIYVNEDNVVSYPICFMDAYGNPQYYIADASIYQNVSGTLDTFTYSFNANGGSGAPGGKTKTHGKSFTFPSTKPSRTGYTFNGWYNGSVNNGAVYVAGQSVSGLPNQNIKWYASWTANTYTVKYNGNGNSGGSTANSSHTYDVAKALTSNGFVRTGYTFTGWNTKADGSGTAYSNGASVKNLTTSNDGSVTLYAQWEINQYILTVNPNGGTWNGLSYSSDYKQNYGSTKSIPHPTRVGYAFNGWNLSGSGSLSGTTYTYGAGNGSLAAQWTRIVLTVTFNASSNGGSTDSTRNVYYGDTVGSLPIPTKQFYKFVGWFTKPIGGTKVSASQVITSNVTYYAQFKIDASVKVNDSGTKKPAIVWVKVNGVWEKCVTWIKKNGKWNKSSGAD